ncbi:hypothetical protein [Tissierella sp. Yu-01]|uniref:hypothetical protein n=1 Tax=Tissierella sp. Yu-01 TaxID=3035694 RepID=UPI00240E9723|nr:hypothetical protein [Tissierella sp. Yu-01]WFA09502.1 hypothetical protein P3962_02825 [Tissierella sp. Yu-01]
MEMDCLSCGNCKEEQSTYFCLAKNEVVINQNQKPVEKKRTGWKKGSSNYESHRRQFKKEVEV